MTLGEDDPLAEVLSPVLSSLSREVDQLRVLSGRLRIRVRLLALSFALFFLLTAALGTVFWRVERVNATAAAARAATIQSCASDNVQRAESLRLWTYVLSEQQHSTASEREASTGFLAGLTDIYSQSPCPTH